MTEGHSGFDERGLDGYLCNVPPAHQTAMVFFLLSIICTYCLTAIGLGVREVSGKNDGKRVEEYLSSVGLKRGDPYCAAFVSWVFRQAGHPEPRAGWSPALFPARLLVKEAKPGDVFGIWFPALKRIAHAGFVKCKQGDFLQTIEANTNLKGSREGDGVYRKMRHRRSIYRLADWLLPLSTHHLNTSTK